MNLAELDVATLARLQGIFFGLLLLGASVALVKAAELPPRSRFSAFVWDLYSWGRQLNPVATRMKLFISAIALAILGLVAVVKALLG